MSYQETAVEIEKEIEKFNDARLINKFISLITWYHFKYCEKSPCGSCKLIKDFKDSFLFNFDKMTSSNIICYFQNHCRQNYNEFCFLFKLLKSIAAIERERRKLKIRLETLIRNGL